ncbi:MAG: DUF885 domain-containing protein [Psychrobium sp.]
MKKTLLSMAVVAIITGCATSQSVNEQASSSQVVAKQQLSKAQVNQLIEQHTLDYVKQQPALSTSLKLSNDYVANYNQQLPDYSPQGMKKLQQTMRKAALELANIELVNLPDDTKLHLQVNRVIDNYYAGSEMFEAGYIDTWGGHLPYIVSQIAGPLMDIPKILENQQPVTNLAQANDYITRLEALASMVGQVHQKVAFDAEKGVILPKKLFPNTLKFLNAFVAPDVDNHALMTSFKRKLEQASIGDERLVNALMLKAHNVMTLQVYPAYQRVNNLMVELRERAPEGDGIWAQPNGSEFYLHEVQFLGDSDLTPEQIHNIGLSEVKRISEEMDKLLRSQGLDKGTVGERMVALAEDPKQLFADSDAGRQELLDYLNQEIDVIMQKAPQLFATMPTIGVEVKRIPKVIEAGAPGGFYTPPTLDGTRKGEFAINLRNMKEVPKFSLKTLTYHEAAPGHHFQIALNMEQTDIGLMRQNAPFNGFVEGWALYSELVALEMGMYEGDVWGNLGRLQAELYRAVRLVVDTGLHYKKWTREKAIDYFHTTTGTGLSDVTSEIERYMAWPGQALGYKLGMLKFVELRQTAERELGDKFDIKGFHDLILLKGARPMSIVEADVMAWIEANK